MIQQALNELSKQIRIRPRYDNFIGGKWIAAGQGPILRQPDAGSRASRSARSPAPRPRTSNSRWMRPTPLARSGAAMPAAERAALLNRIADRMESNLELLAMVETLDNGKPIRETMAADLPLAIDHFRYFAGCIRAQEGSFGDRPDTVAYHFHEPLGVVGQIIPWNFPLLMAVWKLAPALAAGNCVVLKPAEQTPMSIMVLMDLIGDFLPPGVLNVVNGFGVEAGKPLAQNKRIAKVAFTGETTTGPADHAVRLGEHHPGHARARRQVAQHLLRRRHAEPMTTISTRRSRASPCSR